MLNAKKNNTGPNALPVNAKDAPIAAVIGLNVPQKIGSPTPQKGPINPILILPIVPSSISAPFAFASSIAAVTPKTGPTAAGVTLKNVRCLFNAATCSSFVSYNLLIAGTMSKHIPNACILS